MNIKVEAFNDGTREIYLVDVLCDDGFIRSWCFFDYDEMTTFVNKMKGGNVDEV